PTLDHIVGMPYTAFQAALDPTAPPGLRSYWRGEYLDALSDAAIDVFLAHATRVVTPEAPLSQAVLFRIGQAVADLPDDAAGFSPRAAPSLRHPIAVWADASDDERRIAGARSVAEAMRPFATGASYLNFTPEANRVHDAYGDAKYARLVALKDVYD